MAADQEKASNTWAVVLDEAEGSDSPSVCSGMDAGERDGETGRGEAVDAGEIAEAPGNPSYTCVKESILI
jgi:hypothetical protein